MHLKKIVLMWEKGVLVGFFLRVLKGFYFKKIVAYAGFSKGGGRKFRKFENNKDQNENFPVQNQARFPAQN